MARPISERLRERARSVRSQLRRYPRAIAEALREPPTDPSASPPDTSDLLPSSADRLASAWLGHATALLRLGNTTVLTDPVFSRRIGPRVVGRTVGPARLQDAPLHAGALRGADIILLSHAHFDHLDLPSLETLADARTTVITAKGTRNLLPRGFRRVIELPWNRTFRVGGVDITALEADHWGARHALDRWRRHNAYLVDATHSRVLFAGDTAATDAFDNLKNVDLAMLGIGAYEGWRHRHATPEEAWEMFRRMRAAAMMATHHATFDMGESSPDEPMQRLLRAAGEHERHVVCRETGDPWIPEIPDPASDPDAKPRPDGEA